jgi:hypothetical protein
MTRGLCGDAVAREGLMTRECGNRDIKASRRQRPVPIHPFGCVGDYAPFYFAPRSPTMSAISNGRVPEYGTDASALVYLVTTTEALVAAGLTVVVTDRNARLGVAEFRPESECDDLVDWNLMRQKLWFNTPEDPERRERRMAECLVAEPVPFGLFHEIVVHNDAQGSFVKSRLAEREQATPVFVRPHWYI